LKMPLKGQLIATHEKIVASDLFRRIRDKTKVVGIRRLTADKYCISMVDECVAMPEVQELHNSVKTVGTRATDIFMPLKGQLIATHEKIVASDLFRRIRDKTKVKMSVVFVVWRTRLGIVNRLRRVVI
jgi:hypothetical protein